jgi:hypothetical protein
MIDEGGDNQGLNRRTGFKILRPGSPREALPAFPAEMPPLPFPDPVPRNPLSPATRTVRGLSFLFPLRFFLHFFKRGIFFEARILWRKTS